MSRLWIAAAGNGKVRILLGAAAAREKRRLGQRIDRTIARALRGDLADADVPLIENLAVLAAQIAGGK